MTAIPQHIATFGDDYVGVVWPEAVSVDGHFASSLADLESRFGIYRDSANRLIEAVASRYPVVRKLLWDDAFGRVAAQYLRVEPLHSPVSLEFGASFPQFLRTIGEGVAVDYLA